MLRVEVQRDAHGTGVSLFGDDGVVMTSWTQADHGEVHDARPELHRSLDGFVALVMVDEVFTVVRLEDGTIAASGHAGRGIEVSLPLDTRWTLELAGALVADEGFSGHYSGGLGFFWSDLETRPDPAEMEREVARMRAEFAAAANVSIRRRVALRSGTRTVVVHEADVSPAEGGEALLWPPIVGPAGVLLRHAIETDDGRQQIVESQEPWLVRLDGTVTRLPFELGVSPLLALEDGRWLLPGADALWRDDYDEPLSFLDATGKIEPLLIGGQPVPASRVLRETVPDVLSERAIDPTGDVPWRTVSARVDSSTDELLLAIEVDRAEDQRTLIIAALPLAGGTPARLLAQIESTAKLEIAVAP